MSTHQLLGAEVSYYTGKVRAYLRYKGIPFEEVAASRDIYKDVIVPRTGVRMIPVLISDDDVAVQDSSVIIDFMEERYPEASVYPQSPLQRFVALLFEAYGDEWLVIPAMHYRWSFEENRRFAIAEFGRLSAPDASPEEQVEIGEKLSGPFAGALPYLGVSDDTIPGIEDSYLSFLADFNAHLRVTPFLLGSRPSIGDFGLYGPLYAHLYRDPYSGRIMKEKAPAVVEWVERMRDPAVRAGEFLDNDAIPETLEPMLLRMFAEQGPVLSNTIRAVAEWASENDDVSVPRTIGRHAFAIGGRRGQRNIVTFNLWMWQRARDQYQALEGSALEQANALLQRVGGQDLIQQDIPQRVARENNRLVLVRESRS
ncbi:glutathione S-transferase family protein [Gilvimarinus sp. F26214L]|uniref:glutathione S-transferase family protein n=1 Tax=Gilvimarinus sp. DZF01 TaxID=3461371 RepID=UPI00404609D3